MRARCVRSQLMSESDTQSIVKKAIVERLKEVYHVEWFAETAATVAIDVHIRNDHVTIGLDSSGAPLSKRGYRTWNGEAPSAKPSPPLWCWPAAGIPGSR